MLALDRSCDSSRAQNCTKSQHLLLSPPSSLALERPLLTYPRALLSLVLSVRVQSQGVLHNLAILDLGDLFLFSVPTVGPSCLFLYSPKSTFQMSDEKKVEVGSGWIVTMEVGLNRLNLTTWVKQASS